MESDQWKSILDMLGMDNDPFRNGTDCCCTIHTNANRCKSALNGIRDIDGMDELPYHLVDLERSCKTILYEGCRLFEVCGRIHIPGMYMGSRMSSLRHTPIGHDMPVTDSKLCLTVSSHGFLEFLKMGLNDRTISSRPLFGGSQFFLATRMKPVPTTSDMSSIMGSSNPSHRTMSMFRDESTCSSHAGRDSFFKGSLS